MGRFVAGLMLGLVAGGVLAAIALRSKPAWLVRHQSPHDAYAASLREAHLDATELGRAWLAEADRALREPATLTLPASQTLTFRATEPRAFGFRVRLERGRALQATAAADAASPPRLFVDVFRVEDGREPDHIASTDDRAAGLTYEASRDGWYVVRVQPELLRDGAVRLVQLSLASLVFPVAKRGAIGSVFGDPRDAGRRRHEGIDIFAPRGTHAIAAADGIVTSTGTTNLGGNVVWLFDPARRLSQYYAHLDRQLVRPGQVVHAGDPVGLVGNTGNARTTPPHLHFGLYALGEGAIDPLPFVRPPGPPQDEAHTPDTRSPEDEGTAGTAGRSSTVDKGRTATRDR
jgi:murein DD-endopeptidase MepM/ murein hydrolase activator NlpD